jgi:hypothetical protein
MSSGVRNSRNLSDCSVLAHSDNRRYGASPSATPKFRLTAKLPISPEPYTPMPLEK